MYLYWIVKIFASLDEKRYKAHRVVTLPYQGHTAGTFVAILGLPSDVRSSSQCNLKTEDLSSA